MTANDRLVELLGRWEADNTIVHGLYGRAGGETAFRVRGTVELLSAARLAVRAPDASLIFSLAGAKLEYGPLRYVPPPFTKLESVDGLHIRLKHSDWAFLTAGKEIPEDVERLAAGMARLEDH